MLDKIISIGLIVVCAMLVVFNHIDRGAFLDELENTRTAYIRTLESMSGDIKDIKKDVITVKEMLEKQEAKNSIKQEIKTELKKEADNSNE